MSLKDYKDIFQQWGLQDNPLGDAENFFIDKKLKVKLPNLAEIMPCSL
jgi:hypothetical protein